MKLKKPDWKILVITIESFILLKILFYFWDEVKDYIAGIFS